MKKNKESHSDQMINIMNEEKQEELIKSKQKVKEDEKMMIKQLDHLESLRRGKSKY
tara:strand:- start:511 stop:678 length:168 start_codon:yes stop_codon:yes gene_type:complete